MGKELRTHGSKHSLYLAEDILFSDNPASQTSLGSASSSYSTHLQGNLPVPKRLTSIFNSYKQHSTHPQSNLPVPIPSIPLNKIHQTLNLTKQHSTASCRNRSRYAPAALSNQIPKLLHTTHIIALKRNQKDDRRTLCHDLRRPVVQGARPLAL